eukprot:CAMPEP_0119028834 /NCGR_PEP_ID=MMETSP1176-20130426/39613_1 /TAXON_ID=265551 /ORGANISM="Synedropsis recta cf, Strain CCMP1620" /LENGTH=152 /DNA_ID=CAMNT_0006985065 /DNA_START=264 /DNA_END=719 /DNA_ORIENTATION=+
MSVASHMIWTVFLNVDIILVYKHVNAHENADNFAQCRCDAYNIVDHALVRLGEISICAKVQVVLDMTRVFNASSEVDFVTRAVRTLLSARRFETSIFVQTIPFRINNTVTSAACPTIMDDINSRYLPICHVNFVLRRQLRAYKLFNNDLCCL